MTMKLLLSAAISCLAVAHGAAAADWESSIEGGVFSTSRSSTDTDIDGSPFYGAYVGGYAATEIGGGYRFAIDGRVEKNGDSGNNDVYYTGPTTTGAFGVHVGREFSFAYLGAYAGAGLFTGYDDASDAGRTAVGTTLGFEVEKAIWRGKAYGQIGYVSANGDSGDNEFEGYDITLGYAAQVTDRFGMNLFLEQAYSGSCFEDCGGDWGRYRAGTLEVNYSVNDKLDVVGAVSRRLITANSEDKADETNVYLGVRMAFGAKPTSNLRTPMGGFQAAGWMAPLD